MSKNKDDQDDWADSLLNEGPQASESPPEGAVVAPDTGGPEVGSMPQEEESPAQEPNRDAPEAHESLTADQEEFARLVEAHKGRADPEEADVQEVRGWVVKIKGLDRESVALAYLIGRNLIAKKAKLKATEGKGSISRYLEKVELAETTAALYGRVAQIIIDNCNVLPEWAEGLSLHALQKEIARRNGKPRGSKPLQDRIRTAWEKVAVLVKGEPPEVQRAALLGLRAEIEERLAALEPK